MPSRRTISVAVLVCLVGCATVRNYDFELSGTLGQASIGDVDGAVKRLEANNPQAQKDLLYYFELGMLERLRYRYDDSQKAWTAAQKRIEAPERTGSDLLRNASSFVLSDKLRVYEAHDYEKVMLLTYQALNQLALAHYDEARVAIKQ